MAGPHPSLLSRGAAADEFVELNFKPGSWDSDGIPEQGCSIRRQSLDHLIAGGGVFGPEDAVSGLMDWLDVIDDPWPAIATLRSLLDRHFPSDGRITAGCHFTDETGVDRKLIVGPVVRSRSLVSWQREGLVFALGQPSAGQPGRMVVEVLNPLPLNGALRILAVSMFQFMGEPFDSFESPAALAGTTSNISAWNRGELTTCHWPHGLGVRRTEGQSVDHSGELMGVSSDPPLPPSQVAVMIAIAAGYLSL